MGRRFRIAVLGGTFDRIHAGHERLLGSAFRQAEKVGIGLTSERFLREHPKALGNRIRRYSARRRGLRAYLTQRFPGREFWIASLNDVWGRSVDPGVDLLVVSSETLPGARAVNAERRRRGLPPLEILAVPLVRAEDGKPIHSSRIRLGEIDLRGRKLRPRTGGKPGRVQVPTREDLTHDKPNVRSATSRK